MGREKTVRAIRTIPDFPKLKGEDHPNAKLTEQDVRNIVTLYNVGLYSQREIASQYGIAQMTVSDIITRKKWKHIWT